MAPLFLPPSCLFFFICFFSSPAAEKNFAHRALLISALFFLGGRGRGGRKAKNVIYVFFLLLIRLFFVRFFLQCLFFAPSHEDQTRPRRQIKAKPRVSHGGGGIGERGGIIEKPMEQVNKLSEGLFVWPFFPSQPGS